VTSCDDEYEMLELFCPQSILNLTPPVLSALKLDQVLPEGQIFLFKPRAKFAREPCAVLARIGDEDPARMIAAHRVYP
jgi:hypothetical protein